MDFIKNLFPPKNSSSTRNPTMESACPTLLITTSPQQQQQHTVVERLFQDDMDNVHGFLRAQSWEAPIKVVHNDEEARPGYQSMKRHEYNDTPEVLRAKIKLLTELLRTAKYPLAYTGAGISTAAGIDDYATKLNRPSIRTVEGPGNKPTIQVESTVNSSRARVKTPFDAQPTFAHHALAALYRNGLLKHWIQQNHDGLPQKAGFPQHALNEIHGAWYDPSNPVVPMSGDLRGDLFEQVLEWEEKTDLCITLGTSLSGMNCDRVVETIGTRAKAGEAGRLGAVIVGLQRTRLDNVCAVRIFASIDDTMELLLAELGLAPAVSRVEAPYRVYAPLTLPRAAAGGGGGFFGATEEEGVFVLPYSGRSGRGGPGRRCTLDLREGAWVRLTEGPHAGDEGEVQGRTRPEGHYKICFWHRLKPGAKLKRPMVRVLGAWWLESAVAGLAPRLPVVNVPPAGASAERREEV